MKERDYVRIKNEAGWCCIGKIVNINEFREPDMKYCIDIQGEDYIFVPEDMIAKSSTNIKSVIEKDDFVNGERVNRVIPEDICGDELLDYQHIFVDDKEIYEEDIKSIVTKEQFERMEYKVGE